jgi:hypothetical protein
MIGRQAAHELSRTLDLSAPVDLRPVVSHLGLEVIDWPFAGRLREVIVDGVIGVDMRLPRPWVRWLVAHAVGHHLLHTGACFSLDSWRWVSRVKAERQAEEFAAALLMPEAPLGSVSPEGMARRLGVPVSKLPGAWGGGAG